MSTTSLNVPFVLCLFTGACTQASGQETLWGSGNGFDDQGGAETLDATPSDEDDTADHDLRLDVGNVGGVDVCGDGLLTSGEACDDRNEAAGDGCSQDCGSVEPGWVCPVAGESCRQFARCGDGVRVFPEQCDDGNSDDADGCSPTCKVEIGWKCDETAPNVCSRTVCGDGIQEGSETCEDENGLPFDGCSALCQSEPSCSSDGCVSRCGDGLIIGDEQCDDGNAVDGDGCSSACQEEAGYACERGSGCPDGGADCPLTLPIVFRDFNVNHVDFRTLADPIPDCVELVGERLDDTGKPVLGAPNAACIDSAESFAQWYGASSGEYSTILGEIALFANGSGGYVNRYGENGEQYVGEPVGTGRWCGNPEQQDGCGTVENEGACNGEPFDPDTESCWLVEEEHGPGVPIQCCLNCFCAGSVEQSSYDGNPLFFPIDGHPDALEDERFPAQIPEEIYDGGWRWETPGDVDTGGMAGPDQPLHNFHFTSEIAYWFEYEDGSSADLTFIGDDDVWVFVNRRLVLDLGGIHAPWAGQLSMFPDGTVSTRTWLPPNEELSATETTAADLGMVNGGVYEIKVFHAERKSAGSSFQLTLSGFNTARSECRAICGDGILAAGEECDLGNENNVGGHNGCNADCTLGAYCGDGIVQEEEQCDDRDPQAPPMCFGCRILNAG